MDWGKLWKSFPIVNYLFNINIYNPFTHPKKTDPSYQDRYMYFKTGKIWKFKMFVTTYYLSKTYINLAFSHQHL